MNRSYKNLILTIMLVLVFNFINERKAIAAESSCAPASAMDEQLLKLQIENAGLTLKAMQLDGVKSGITELLHNKKLAKLKETAKEVSEQRETTKDFEGFFKWMSSNLAGYNRYIQAGSYLAGIGKMLPIPYAGQASVFTKFLAQFTVSLNSASVAVNSYHNSSQKFLKMVSSIESNSPTMDKQLAEAEHFANNTLLKDMHDTQTKLKTVADLSSGALSFLETLNHYVGETDAYWNKVKGLMRKNVDPKEKSYISESTTSLKHQADNFNRKMKNFEELGKKETANVNALAVYDELAVEALTLLK